MRRIIINEGQDAMLRVASMPIFSIMHNKVSDGEIYVPLNDVSIADKLLAKAISKSADNFNDDMTTIDADRLSNSIGKLIVGCIKKETEIRGTLEQLCYDVVSKILGVTSNDITFELDLVNNIEPSHIFHIKRGDNGDRKYDSYSFIEDESSEIEKRHLLNCLVHGIAADITNTALKASLSQIFELDEELPHMYSKLLKLNDYAVTTVDDEPRDNDHHQGGYVEVFVSNGQEADKISVKAVVYPILVFETVKGVMEAVISQYLPQDRSVATAVLDSTDTLIQDNWNYRIGKSIWDNVREITGVSDSEVLPLLSTIASKSASEVKGLFREVLHNTRKGDQILKDMSDELKYSESYQGFLDDLDGKRKTLITDDDDYSFLIN